MVEHQKYSIRVRKNVICHPTLLFKSMGPKYRFKIYRSIIAKSLQSCPTLYNPIDGSPPSSPVPGILQARTLEWVAISFSNAGK